MARTIPLDRSGASWNPVDNWESAQRHKGEAALFPDRQRAFGRRSRRRLAVAVLLISLVLITVYAGSRIQEQLVQRLVITPTSTTTGAGPFPSGASAEANARIQRDLPMLEDLWGWGGGQSASVWYVEAPKGITAGEPLLVTVRGLQLDGHPFDDALVEISWRLGDATYRDVTYTDRYGNAEVNRELDPGCKGRECIVAVRMSRDDLQGLAYSTFVAR